MKLTKELEFAKDMARKAGAILLNNYDNPTGIETKADGSLVSDVDKKVSEFISSQLRSTFPDYGLLDEEQSQDETRFKREFCWVVDPLDGTREYLNRGDNFGVIIGLMHNFKPIMGVTYKPQIDELVYAQDGQGAFIEDEKGARRIYVSTETELRVLVSNSRSSTELEQMLERIYPYQLERQGGSLKTIEIAKGSSDLFLCPATSVMHLWDFCGPSAILQEAGGKITDRYGNPFDYSRKDTANNNGVIASNGIIHDEIVERLR